MKLNLISNKFFPLPLGAVKPEGYLKTQLRLQSENFTKKMPQYPEYNEHSAWLLGRGEQWERGPYYMRGLVALAYTTEDPTLLITAKKWVNAILRSQKKNGDFGPTTDWWAKMPVLYAMRDFYLAEKRLGKEETEVYTFFERYLRFQLKKLPFRSLKRSGYWAKMRGGDNLEIVLWFYETQKQNGKKAEQLSWLEDLASLLLLQTFDWCKKFSSGRLEEHVVNIAQALKYPFLRYRMTAAGADLEAFEHAIKGYAAKYGRIDGMINADEQTQDLLPTRGSESCAAAETITSLGLGALLLGDASMYDLMEKIAYNTLPNCFTYDLSGYSYYQMQNAVLLTHGYYGFANDHGDSAAFGISGFECCFSNLHMAYPKVVQNMWVQTEHGIAATLYGACTLHTKIGEKKVVFSEETQYPFRDTVTFRYSGDEFLFELALRLPEWSHKAELKINGQFAGLRIEDHFIRLERIFRKQDTIELTFFPEVEVHAWHENAQYVKRGALLFCLPVREDIRKISSNAFREIKYDPIHTDNLEFYPASAWNFSFDRTDVKTEYEVCDWDTSLPIDPSRPPCRVLIDGYAVKNWKLEGNHPETPEACEFDRTKARTLALIPYAFSRLKISVFPEEKEAESEKPLPLWLQFVPPKKLPQRKFAMELIYARGLVQVVFPYFKKATHFFVLETEGSQKIVRLKRGYESGMRTLDKTAFSIDNKKEYKLRLYVYKHTKLSAVSEEYTIYQG